MKLTAFAPNSDATAVYRGYTGTGTLMPAFGSPSLIRSFTTVYNISYMGHLNTVTFNLIFIYEENGKPYFPIINHDYSIKRRIINKANV